MKIFKIVMICSVMLTLISTASFAETVATTTGGTPLALTSSTNATSPAFSFTPSPSTIMAVQTSALAFALTAASTKTTTANGVMYGVLSSQSPVYQYAQQADGALVAPASEASLGSSWADKSGNTAP